MDFVQSSVSFPIIISLLSIILSVVGWGPLSNQALVFSFYRWSPEPLDEEDNDDGGVEDFDPDRATKE